MSHQYCRAAYYHFINIQYLKAFLAQETLVTLVHAFLTYRIHYYNSLLYGTSDYNNNRRQRIQNNAASIVTNQTWGQFNSGIGIGIDYLKKMNWNWN